VSAHAVVLDVPVSASHREEIERRLFFVSDAIVDFHVSVDGPSVVGVDVELRPEVDPDTVLPAIRDAVADVSRMRLLPSKITWESDHTQARDADLFERLVARGDVVEMGDGQVAFSARMVALLDHFDREIRGLAVEDFGATEYRYPTLIPSRTLETAGYFESFPQFLMLVTRLHNESSNYDAFQEMYDDAGQVDERALAFCRNVDLCLPPTMCYHTFAQHRGVRLGVGERRVVTAVGKSFRYESRYAHGLARLWDFTIREIVFMGTHDDVVDARCEFMARAIDYVEALGLQGRCEVANDPFFCRTDLSSRILSQRLLELKYELRLDTTPGDDVAIASFNLHNDHFASAFDIADQEGATANSACVGFGLERFVFAFLCQLGLDESAWPDGPRAAVGGTR